MHTPMKHVRANKVEPQREEPRSLGFECVPWVAPERILDEPRARFEEPLRLEIDEHVVEAALDGDAIRRAD
jgi:hypothetical protein